MSLDLLTPREREVFDQAIFAKRNDQIASDLGVSVKTVETHRSRINQKLGVTSPAELILFAVRTGTLTRGMLK